jgi:hypothetical protein
MAWDSTATNLIKLSSNSYPHRIYSSIAGYLYTERHVIDSYEYNSMTQSAAETYAGEHSADAGVKSMRAERVDASGQWRVVYETETVTIEHEEDLVPE